MFKNIFRLILLVFFVARAGSSSAIENKGLGENEKKIATGKSDSLTVVEVNRDVLKFSEIKTQTSPSNTDSSRSIFGSSAEVEQDSTINSALSFNFIYYIIEKFKFKVE